MVNVLTFYSDDLSSNPAGGVYSYFYYSVQICWEGTKINEKEAADDPLIKERYLLNYRFHFSGKIAKI